MRGVTSVTAPLSTVWTLVFAASHLHHVAATTGSPSFFPQDYFFFDWNPPGTTVPIPITQQCETLHIKWQRGSTSQGPNPTSPYFLQIFTSTYTVPFVIPAGSGTSFDFQVPFSPGTQYQICMWDSKGISAGCQDIYTVIPDSSATAQNPVTCANVTLPPPLQVDAADSSGAFSQYGWVPQCTDIQVQAKNGTGPYTMTVAPTLHPPLNITSNGSPVNWTVSLSHGFSFFISVTDSQGNSWAQGPLHSSSNNNTACLNINHSPDSHSLSVIPVTIGASVGCILVGLLAGGFGIPAFRRWRSSRGDYKYRKAPIRDRPESPQSLHEMLASSVGGREYIVEPFSMPSALPSSSSGNPSVPIPPRGKTANPTTSPANAHPVPGPSTNPADQSGRSPAGRSPNVYVVHHDGGRAPVTVYTEEGAALVELPPQYAAGSTGIPSPSENDASREVDRRESGVTPQKTQESRSS